MTRGFSLLEMAITLVVLAIIAVLAVPSYSRYQQRQQLRLVGDALAHDALAAREAAIAQRRPAFLTLRGGSSGWCWGVSVAAPCDCRVAPRACRIALHDGLEHRDVQALQDAQVAWEPLRGDAMAPSRLNLQTRGGESLSVTVNARGRPSLCGTGGARGATPC